MYLYVCANIHVSVPVRAHVKHVSHTHLLLIVHLLEYSDAVLEAVTVSAVRHLENSPEVLLCEVLQHAGVH